MQQAAQIFDKLHRHGLVQAVLSFHGLGNFFRHALGVGERATGNGVHQGEGDQNDHEHGNDHGSDALQDKFNHYIFPLSCARPPHREWRPDGCSVAIVCTCVVPGGGTD